MSNPIGWNPKTDWTPADILINTELNRIETNAQATVDWLKQSGSFDVTTVNIPSGDKQGTVYWEKHAQGLVCLRFPELLGTNRGPHTGIALQLSPVVAWPDDILIAFEGVYVPFLVMDDAPTIVVLPANIRDGRLEVPYEANTDINLYSMAHNSNLFDDNCGIIEQYISYYTTDSVYTTTPAP